MIVINSVENIPIGKGGLSVVDVSNHGHVTDVLGDVHETTDLLDGEAVGRMLSAGCVLVFLATWAVSCAGSAADRAAGGWCRLT